VVGLSGASSSRGRVRGVQVVSALSCDAQGDMCPDVSLIGCHSLFRTSRRKISGGRLLVDPVHDLLLLFARRLSRHVGWCRSVFVRDSLGFRNQESTGEGLGALALVALTLLLDLILCRRGGVGGQNGGSGGRRGRGRTIALQVILILLLGIFSFLWAALCCCRGWLGKCIGFDFFGCFRVVAVGSSSVVIISRHGRHNRRVAWPHDFVDGNFSTERFLTARFLTWRIHAPLGCLAREHRFEAGSEALRHDRQALGAAVPPSPKDSAREAGKTRRFGHYTWSGSKPHGSLHTCFGTRCFESEFAKLSWRTKKRADAQYKCKTTRCSLGRAPSLGQGLTWSSPLRSPPPWHHKASSHGPWRRCGFARCAIRASERPADLQTRW
jgi:hypothetical protein